MASTADIFVEEEAFATWRVYLERLGPPKVPITLPTPGEYPEVLSYLDVPEEDRGPIVASAPSLQANPELWWILQRAAWSLVSRMGDVDPPATFVPVRDPRDPNHRYFFVHVCVATLPYVRAYFAQRCIPETIGQASLADLGRNIRVHRKRYGVGGLGVAFWVMRHFRGTIYQLGRLQFERTRLGEGLASSMIDAGFDVRPEDLVLSIHIPDFMGPLSPEACDQSIDMARAFFSRHFPEERYVAAVCHSWLLDPQLRAYLPPSSNIIRFQDRFHLGGGDYDASTSVLQFVFGPVPSDLDELPRRTTLERAIVTHLKAGGTWRGRSGWFSL